MEHTNPKDYKKALKQRLEACLPKEAINDIEAYVKFGQPLGDFLTAIFSNNLFLACAKADIYNETLLFSYVEYIWNFTPSSCWGSKEIVLEWIRCRQLVNKGESV